MGLDMIMLMVLDLQPQQEIITIPVTQTPVQQLHHIGNGKNFMIPNCPLISVKLLNYQNKCVIHTKNIK